MMIQVIDVVRGEVASVDVPTIDVSTKEVLGRCLDGVYRTNLDQAVDSITVTPIPRAPTETLPPPIKINPRTAANPSEYGEVR